MSTGVYIRNSEMKTGRHMLGRKPSKETIEKILKSRAGYSHSDEVKKKISNGLKGHLVSLESRKKMSNSQSGKKHSEEHKTKQSIIMMGHKHSEETKQKIGNANRGKKKPPFSIERRRKMGDAHRGNKCHLWRGGITPINQQIRTSFEYKLWRESVFKRDNWTCIWCGQQGGKLNADHIKPFAYFPELRFAIDNGRTLCIDCHRKTETYANNYKKLIKKI